jgi:hypothetical protein
MKPIELVQMLIRAFGAFWLVSGVVQVVLAAALISIAAKSPMGVLGACAVQMGVFSIGSIVIGAVLIAASGPMARFAAKVSALPPSAA